MRALLSALAAASLVACLAATATAEPLRLHLGAGAAHAFTGHQKNELGFGADGLGAVELPLTRAIGLQLELGALWLSQGDAPKDPTLARGGSATAYTGGLGLRVRPFASSYDNKAFGPAGLWLAGVGGVAATGGLARGMLDAQLGFDVLLDRGKLGVGPMAGYLHVFQPDSALRPDDANIAILGVHVMWDTAKPKARHVVRRRVVGPDRDGMPDKHDSCPEHYAGGDVDEHGVCLGPDRDHDGIPDKRDLCPDEPETKNGYADQDGCPDEEQVRVVGNKILLDDRVHFRVNSWIIRSVSFNLLNHLAKLLKDHPEYVRIDVEGHADQRGPEWFNKRLSRNRAKAVLEYLVKHGVAESRLSYHGYGSSRPLVKKNTEHAWYLNRRVEFTVTRQVKKVIHRSAKPEKPGAARKTNGAPQPPAASDKPAGPRTGGQP